MCSAVFSAGAMAWIPPAEIVLEAWCKRIETVKTLNIVRTVTLFDNSYPGGSVEAEEEIWIRRPDYFRRTLKFPQGALDWIVSPSGSVRISSGNVTAVSPLDALGPLGILLTYNDTKRMATALDLAGVTTSTTRLELLGFEVLIVIGDPARSQIALLNNAWIPRAATLGERRFAYNSAVPPRFPLDFPESEEISIKDRLVERAVTSLVNLNPPLSERTFAVPRTQRMTP